MSCVDTNRGGMISGESKAGKNPKKQKEVGVV